MMLSTFFQESLKFNGFFINRGFKGEFQVQYKLGSNKIA